MKKKKSLMYASSAHCDGKHKQALHTQQSFKAVSNTSISGLRLLKRRLPKLHPPLVPDEQKLPIKRDRLAVNYWRSALILRPRGRSFGNKTQISLIQGSPENKNLGGRGDGEVAGGVCRSGREGWGRRLRSIAGYCLVTPGGGGLVWASARSQPPTHPPIHPTLPHPGGGGSMPSTRSHIQALENLWNNRAKLTSNKLPSLGLEPRISKLEVSTTTNLRTTNSDKYVQQRAQSFDTV